VQIDWLEGSGEKCNPCDAAAIVTCVLITPARRLQCVARDRGGEWVNRFNVMTMPSVTAAIRRKGGAASARDEGQPFVVAAADQRDHFVHSGTAGEWPRETP
jgi:hypothetical protein